MGFDVIRIVITKEVVVPDLCGPGCACCRVLPMTAEAIASSVLMLLTTYDKLPHQQNSSFI